MPGTNLKLVFTGSINKKVNFNYPDANSASSAAVVKNLMQRIVTNGDIFAEQPLALESATFITTTSVPVNLN